MAASEFTLSKIRGDQIKSLSGSTDDLPVAFYFRAIVADSGGMHALSFQEVTGIGSEIDLEEVPEGEENRFVHRLPKSVKHPKLALKRGVGKMDSPFIKWCLAVLENVYDKPIETKPLVVMLLNEEGDPARAWSFDNVYPVNWEIEAFNSTKNEVAVEKIELSYNFSKRLI